MRYSEKDENNYLASLLVLYAEFAEGLELEKKASTRQGVMARGWHPISLHKATQATEKPRDQVYCKHLPKSRWLQNLHT